LAFLIWVLSLPTVEGGKERQKAVGRGDRVVRKRD
jgi:hypothetical protein